MTSETREDIKKYVQERLDVLKKLVERYGEKGEDGLLHLDFYSDSPEVSCRGEWKEINGVALNKETGQLDFNSEYYTYIKTRAAYACQSDQHRETYSKKRRTVRFDRPDSGVNASFFVDDYRDPKYYIEKILLAAVNSTISNGKNCQAGPYYPRERDETVALIKKYCSNVINSKLSSQKSGINKWENAWNESSNHDQYMDKGVFNEIKNVIGKHIEKEYGGRLDLPETIPLNGSNRAMAATNWSWMAAFNSIDANGRVYMNGESDDLNATCGGYGIDFLNNLNNLVGGPKFKMEKESIKRDIDMTDIEKLSKRQILDRWFDAQSRNGEMPFNGLLNGHSGYVCNKLCRNEEGGYFVEYHIYPQSGMHDPKLQESVSAEDIEKSLGHSLLFEAREYHESFNSDFNEAFFDLMPHLYEQMVIKDGIIPENLHEVLEYADTKNKIQTKLSELKGKTSTDNVLDDSKTKIQVLREVAKGNVSEEKGVTNRKRDDNSITKQTTKAMLGEKSTQR